MLYGGFFGGMPQPQYSQPQYQQAQRRPAGGWYMCRDFGEVQATPLPADGSQVMFMLENEPTFYICSMQAGRKVCQGYSFEALKEAPEAPPSMQSIAARLDAMTAQLAKHEAFINDLGGMTDDKSNSNE